MGLGSIMLLLLSFSLLQAMVSDHKLEVSLSSLSLPSPRWWSKDTTAVVTGANKGIGFWVVKRLAELGLTVILTARDNSRGIKAVHSLKEIGLRVHFCRLDVSNLDSISSFVSWFRLNFRALDILVNNAAVSFNGLYENSVEHAEEVLMTNFHGAKFLTMSLLPFFRSNSPSKCRILNISSRLGSINKVRNPKIKALLEDKNLTEDQIEEVVTLFKEDVKNKKWKSNGWPEIWTDYSVSKLALNAYSRILAKHCEGYGLSVNSFCPGFTQTSMTGGKGTHSADDAASLAVSIALLSPQDLQTGIFYVWRSNPKSNL